MAEADRIVHGIDIGGTKIELVAFRAAPGAFEELHRERIATPAEDFESFVLAVTDLIARADATLGVRAPVGIGLPGVTDAATGRQLSSNLPAVNGRLAAARLRAGLARPVAFGNDCQCFALSEAQGGAAAGMPSMFGAILGTGAGGGFCLDGKLQRGHNGVAGEWGHWPVPAALLEYYTLPVIDCPCGRRGCLERYVSGPGLARLYRHFGGASAEPLAIVGRANAGDAAAARTLDAHLDLLGQALAGLVLTLDPHVLVLGGGLSKLPHLYERLPGAIGRHLFHGALPPPVLPPRFGDAGGARGAALLVQQALQA